MKHIVNAILFIVACAGLGFGFGAAIVWVIERFTGRRSLNETSG